MRLSGFSGRRALVTGAAGGIGRETVRLLHDAGARVIATDTAEALASLPDDIRACAGIWLPCDLRDPAAIEAMLATAEAQAGPIGLAAHTAGVLALGPLLEMTAEDWRRVMAINLDGSFHLLQALGRRLVRQPGAALVVVSSNAAGIPRLGMGAYCASKAALTMLTRCLGLELARQGLRCNVLAPGSTLTPMQTAMWTDDQGPARVIAGDGARFRTGIPLGKLATPADIAQAAVFLLSDQAGHITMADLYIDGGATLRG
ncbi:2,3-dihydro-2,3-dihydroxybenzoate dehydrogenase [Rhodobacter capsulatus]|uniref:SDR family oxidoreductase n=1 Tax=Rhodobacter capsulatus TaxID=1061 RepID=UPI0006DBFD2F|nr:SDR family oxidoreductase [Rhodobacter capsulatus]KQB13834.1 2,3-dihydro-2,3-dihydroxybenzoate dehydrogenase [Rhodobacter capsulatus]PZX21470.1 2,3-dihydro-2,3-dihydroxybenzoate dehydrogenase [Rhodobacter capsulatus]